MKAFLVTRVGDVGFLLGIALLGVDAGSFRIADVLAPRLLPPATLTAACLLLLAGVAGKSAQFPLHTWLPDAMAGPTPISALIHAATMVAAGVYVVARLFPLFDGRAGRAGRARRDGRDHHAARRAGRHSPRTTSSGCSPGRRCSQLGYMTGALAVGAPAAALFHLLTHAAFKALLFLAAGAVIHAVGTQPDVRHGRAARADAGDVLVASTIGLGALAGLPPLAGFWSKEAILRGGRCTRAPTAGAAWLVYVAGAGHRRAHRLVRDPPVAAHLLRRRRARRRPRTGTSRRRPMRWPVLLLAVPSALLGLRRRCAPASPSRLGPAEEALHLGPERACVPLVLARGSAPPARGGCGGATRRGPGRGAGPAAAGCRERLLPRRGAGRPGGPPGARPGPRGAPRRRAGGGRRGRGDRRAARSGSAALLAAAAPGRRCPRAATAVLGRRAAARRGRRGLWRCGRDR